jgi:nucleoside diphosphate kinase
MFMQALVFIKPQANTPATVELVRSMLEKAGCTIVEEGSIDGSVIDERRLIDQHYYAIASKVFAPFLPTPEPYWTFFLQATLLSPGELSVPADKFAAAMGEDWSTVLREGRAANALQACKQWDCTPAELEITFRKAEKIPGNVVKLGGGFYCGRLPCPAGKAGPAALYVFNAFFMAMRAKFVGPDHSIHYFSVEWEPCTMSWAHFRGELLGPTDPLEAPPTSLRGSILAQWARLGIACLPSKGDNGVHASASPLEGLAEKMNWLQKECFLLVSYLRYIYQAFTVHLPSVYHLFISFCNCIYIHVLTPHLVLSLLPGSLPGFLRFLPPRQGNLPRDNNRLEPRPPCLPPGGGAACIYIRCIGGYRRTGMPHQVSRDIQIMRLQPWE